MSRRVLILEDNDLVAQGLLRGLAYLGHEGIRMRETRAAQELLQSSSDVAAAMIDLGLDDGQNGEDFLNWLRREHPAVKRVVVSGLARPAGFVDDPPHQLFKRKPFGQADLSALLEALQLKKS